MDHPDHYDRQIQSQIAQYADVAEMHDAAPAAKWINARFLRPALEQVFRDTTVVGIYATYLAEAVERTGIPHVVSIGSGYGQLEIDIVKTVRDRGLPPFRITGLELSPILVKRTAETARAEGLQDFISAVETDLNRQMDIAEPVAAFMAHHSLHHLVELELIFDRIAELLPSEGAFVTMDMIGRNGHMRWPETLAVVREVWPSLPNHLKWDGMFKREDRWFENWDCSIEGFEGIRSQDILPLLLDRFRFERFLATGGLADVFYDKRFGRNFNVHDPVDAAFLEGIQGAERHLTDAGKIKPVSLFAVMRSRRSETCPDQPVCYRGLGPEQALRPTEPLVAGPLPTLASTGFVVPFEAPPPPPVATIQPGATASFAKDQPGRSLLRWGWDHTDDDLAWSLGLDAALEFWAAAPFREIRANFVPYSPPSGRGSLSVSVNGIEIKTVDLAQDESGQLELSLPNQISAGETVLMEFSFSKPRRPDRDGGADQRPLGIALLNLTCG